MNMYNPGKFCCCPKLPWMIDFHSTRNGAILNSQLHAAFADNLTEHLLKLNVNSQPPRVNLTKIICTIGPHCLEKDVLESMMAAGMNMIRLNMSSMDYEKCSDILVNIRKANDCYSRKVGRVYPLAIALDIRGQEIRTGCFENPNAQEILLEKGMDVNITTDPVYEEFVTESNIYVDYPQFAKVVKPDDLVYIDNGEIRLLVQEVAKNVVKCVVDEAGKLINNATVSIPGVPIDLPFLSQKDINDIQFGIENKVDTIFISGVKSDEDIQKIKNILGETGNYIMIITKVDCSQGVESIDDIIKESDGIMIDRGALGIELLPEKAFLAQKSIIAKCNMAGKPVICAANVLESMSERVKPIKSEITDVANSVLDGSDCFLLSKEIAHGKWSVQAIQVLCEICKEAEAAVYQKQVFDDLTDKHLIPLEPIYTVAISAVQASLKCNAAVIIVLTSSGRSAKVIAKYRPRCPIIAVTRCGCVARQLQIYRAIYPIHYIRYVEEDIIKEAENRVFMGIAWGKLTGLIRQGNAIVIVNSSRPGAGHTNSIKIVYASEYGIPELNTPTSN